MIKFSIIIPVYNRPGEVDELLESLCIQTFKNFEVIIVEDGSKEDCKSIIEKYINELNIKYYYKENTGPGTTRNYGAERASNNYFIFFDSDCIIPEKYIEIVTRELDVNYVDAFGGPDAAHESFTNVQKAISYSMTSFFTTGGIRGASEKIGKFHPRSFNMGYSRKVFETTNGFSKMRFGEDIDMSLRIISNNFSTALFKDAYVFHKRRTNFKQFFKQVFNSGIARINLYKRHPKSLKIVHFFPSVFFLGSLFLIISSIILLLFLQNNFYFVLPLIPLISYVVLIFFHSLTKNSLAVSALSVYASFIQLFSYGIGFMKSFYIRIILKKEEFHAFRKNFYK